ncbi:MAG: hypothetical protein ACO3ND_02370 [Opitutales bacterium]
MRQVVIARPFAGGYRSDVPDYALEANECAYSQDLIYPFGIAQQRWGWAFDGTVADVASNLLGVDRSRYPVTERSLTTTSATNGYLYIHNATAAGTAIWENNATTSSPSWIPRCMYGGEVIFCAQDGITPLLRYAGSTLANASGWPTGGTGLWSLANLSSSPTISLNTWPAGTEKGSFFSTVYTNSASQGFFPSISARILASPSSTVITLDGIRNASGASTSAIGATGAYVTPVGFAWPAVSVWDAGSCLGNSPTPSQFTFSGADLASAGLLTAYPPMNDALFVLNATSGSPHSMTNISSYSAGPPELLNVLPAPPAFGTTQYKIARRLPFKDATVHKNSLWGTGVRQYPNRVYVAPPLWNVGLPPGSVEPFDPISNSTFADVDEFFLTPVDVPSRFDTDPVTAILSTPGPLLVLKGASVYGIFGAYPSYEQTLLANGSGCIDLRSAFTVDGVAYWAGREGVFMYSGGQIIPLARGRIEREWQALMRGYVAGTSYVSAAVVSNHLVISVGGLTNTATGEAKIGPDSSNPSDRTYIYDLKAQVWTSRISNARMRNMSSVRVPGEVNSIFAVSDDRQGRVIDLTPTVTGVKCTNRASQTLTDADPTDAEGTGPRMQAWSSASLAAANGIEGEARMLDMALHTNLYDTGTPATTSLAVSTAHGEALDDDATSVVTHSPVAGDSVDRVDRSKRRVNRTGRLHQLRVDLSTTAATTKKTQVPEVVLSLRDNRRMT